MRWNWSWWIWPIARVTREFGGEREKCFFSFWMQAECASFCLCSLFILLVYLLIYWLFQQKTLQTNWVSLQHTRGGAGELICLLQSDACESHTFFFFGSFILFYFFYIFLDWSIELPWQKVFFECIYWPCVCYSWPGSPNGPINTGWCLLRKHIFSCSWNHPHTFLQILYLDADCF